LAKRDKQFNQSIIGLLNSWQNNNR